MEKIDFKKEPRFCYKASAKEVELVTIPSMKYLMIDGKGDPGSNDFSNAVEALFGLAYTLKFMVKKGPEQIDYGVMPLEGLWWADDMNTFISRDKSQWMWTAMIMQPELITDELVASASKALKLKKDPKSLDLIRFENFEEGKCAQVLHIGPFEEEGPTIQKMHEKISEAGTMTGKHHEIYLSDIRRAAPEKWKTILRQPYK